MAVAAITRADVERELLRELVAEELGREVPADVPRPVAWAKDNATIVLPTEGRQPFHPYPYQTKILEDRSPRRLILKARQTGISNTVAIEALHKAITRPDSTELFVSRNQDAASVLVRYCQHTLNGLANPPKLVNENLSRLAFPNGSQIISLPATPSTGRSMAATDVYLDEFAFTQYDGLIYESIIGTISTGGSLTILSTPNGRNNMFFRLWSGLEGGEWSRHSIHWSDCPRYDEAWGARTKASMTRQSFAQEYDLDFVASGDAVFDMDDLAACRVGHNPSPDGCSRFINAWDIGRRRDHTVGITIGLRDDTWHVVAYDRVLEPYPVIQSRIDKRHRERHATTVVESNGIGDPVIENLTVRVDPYTTTTKTKVQAIQALQLLIQQGRFKHNEPQLDRELSLYQWDDEGLIQDSVMAASLAAIKANPPTLAGVVGNAVSRGWGTKPADPLNPDGIEHHHEPREGWPATQPSRFSLNADGTLAAPRTPPKARTGWGRR
jgi:hypothetical protein